MLNSLYCIVLCIVIHHQQIINGMWKVLFKHYSLSKVIWKFKDIDKTIGNLHISVYKVNYKQGENCMFVFKESWTENRL